MSPLVFACLPCFIDKEAREHQKVSMSKLKTCFNVVKDFIKDHVSYMKTT